MKNVFINIIAINRQKNITILDLPEGLNVKLIGNGVYSPDRLFDAMRERLDLRYDAELARLIGGNDALFEQNEKRNNPGRGNDTDSSSRGVGIKHANLACVDGRLSASLQRDAFGQRKKARARRAGLKQDGRYFFRQADINFLRSAPFMPFASALQVFIFSCWGVSTFATGAGFADRHSFMNDFRSSPFLSVASLLHVVILDCCGVAA